MSELRDDLQRRIHERLGLWVKDSFALYEMVDEDVRYATSAVISELLRQAVQGLLKSDIDPDDLGQMIAHMLRESRRLYAEHVAKAGSSMEGEQ